MPEQTKILGTHYYRFLAECTFISQKAKQLIYSEINPNKKVVLKTELLFSSSFNSTQNPIKAANGISNILLLAELGNSKIVGGYTESPFSPSLTPSRNTAMILHLSAGKVYKNGGHAGTISMTSDSLKWGQNELVFRAPNAIELNAGTVYSVSESERQYCHRLELYKVVEL